MKVKFKIQGVEFVGDYVGDLLIKDNVEGLIKGIKITLGKDTFARRVEDVEIIEEKKYLRFDNNMRALLHMDERTSYVNYDAKGGLYFLDNKVEEDETVTKFREGDIKRIKSIYGDIFEEEDVE